MLPRSVEQICDSPLSAATVGTARPQRRTDALTNLSSLVRGGPSATSASDRLKCIPISRESIKVAAPALLKRKAHDFARSEDLSRGDCGVSTHNECKPKSPASPGNRHPFLRSVRVHGFLSAYAIRFADCTCDVVSEWVLHVGPTWSAGSSGLLEQPSDLAMTSIDRTRQGGSALVVLHVNVGPSFDQCPRNIDAPSPGSRH